MSAATHILPKGTGYNYYPFNFGRVTQDTPVRATDEPTMRGHVVIYRISDNLRMHTRRDLLRAVAEAAL